MRTLMIMGVMVGLLAGGCRWQPPLEVSSQRSEVRRTASGPGLRCTRPSALRAVDEPLVVFFTDEQPALLWPVDGMPLIEVLPEMPLIIQL